MPIESRQTHFVELTNGRRIAYCEYGDPEGKAVFYFHGTPGSRFEPQFGDQAGKDHGYRIIALDRPGIGQSDHAKGRRLLDWPEDVREAARQLGVERFGVIGVSGGGPYALACAYALPEQADFTALLGSWGPVAEKPALWQEMAPLDRFFGTLSRSAPWTFYIPFSSFGFAAKRLSPESFVKSIDSSMCDADRRLMADPEMARFFAHDIAEAFRQGVRGPADDAIILYGEWGFRLEEIRVPVHLFHGTEDKFAPYGFAEYMQEKLPDAHLHAYPGEGHLFVMRLFGEVFERLAS